MKRSIHILSLCALFLAACVRSITPPTAAAPVLPTITISADTSPTRILSVETFAPENAPTISTLPILDTTVASQTEPVAPSQTPNLPVGDIQEHPVLLIPLAGPINQPDVAITGMAWYSDTLILLPQFPDRFENQGGGSVFSIRKMDLINFLDGEFSGPIVPSEVPFFAPDIRDHISGFDGYHSIAFSGDRIYLTVEAHLTSMVSYLVSGWYKPGLEAIYIDTDRQTPIEPQTQLPDLGYESLVPFGRRMAAIYSANGLLINPAPKAQLFDQDLSLTTELEYPNIEFRISDATSPDESGRFWVINTFTPSDPQLLFNVDPLLDHFGEGQTHRASSMVERLLELQFSEQGIVLTDNPPIQLVLAADGSVRQWSAIAHLDERGFLLGTNGNPQTLFAFVPLNP